MPRRSFSSEKRRQRTLSRSSVDFGNRGSWMPTADEDVTRSGGDRSTARVRIAADVRAPPVGAGTVGSWETPC